MTKEEKDSLIKGIGVLIMFLCVVIFGIVCVIAAIKRSFFLN